ncbi:hypothetical protein SDC9_131140 [bioreactor metagenome]|uniref:Periplasmic binding protein domain-containing protein n=1 Tax=bioreactor metagenome TaxID=1076179 RepID=A0A645D4D9_9ZZZZ
MHQYPFSDIFFDFPETAPPLRWMEFDYVRDHMDRLFDAPCAVIWLLPLSSQIDMMEHLHSKGIPQLLINRDYGRMDAIITDPESSIREGLSWLMIEAGRELAFVAHQPSYLRPYQMPRMLAFYELCIKLGARLAPEALLVRDFSAPEDCFEEIGLQLFSRDRCPRGVFVLNCDLAPQFIQTAARYHRHVGKDYFLLTLDEEPQLARFKGVAIMRQSFRLFRQEILHWLGHVASRSPERFLARPKTELIVQQ